MRSVATNTGIICLVLLDQIVTSLCFTRNALSHRSSIVKTKTCQAREEIQDQKKIDPMPPRGITLAALVVQHYIKLAISSEYCCSRVQLFSTVFKHLELNLSCRSLLIFEYQIHSL